MQRRRLQYEEAQLLAVDVEDALEDVALGDFDRLARHVGASDGDEALRLLRLLALFGVVRHLQVEPRTARVGDEHIVQHDAEQFNDLDLDAQHDHEHRVEHAARMEVADDEALVLQLLDLLLLQLVQRRQRSTASSISLSIILIPPPRSPRR